MNRIEGAFFARQSLHEFADQDPFLGRFFQMLQNLQQRKVLRWLLGAVTFTVPVDIRIRKQETDCVLERLALGLSKARAPSG